MKFPKGIFQQKTDDLEEQQKNHLHRTVDDGFKTGDHVRAALRGCPFLQQFGHDNQKYNASISDAINWFKTMTTNEYIRGVKSLNWKPFDKRIWQRNYWERIIRDEDEYIKISEVTR